MNWRKERYQYLSVNVPGYVAEVAWNKKTQPPQAYRYFDVWAYPLRPGDPWRHLGEIRNFATVDYICEMDHLLHGDKGPDVWYTFGAPDNHLPITLYTVLGRLTS